MKKYANVLKKVTVVAVVGMLVANAFTIATNKIHTNNSAQEFVCMDEDALYLCAGKDDKPDPEPVERPLGDTVFD